MNTLIKSSLLTLTLSGGVFLTCKKNNADNRETLALTIAASQMTLTTSGQLNGADLGKKPAILVAGRNTGGVTFNTTAEGAELTVTANGSAKGIDSMKNTKAIGFSISSDAGAKVTLTQGTKKVKLVLIAPPASSSGRPASAGTSSSSSASSSASTSNQTQIQTQMQTSPPIATLSTGDVTTPVVVPAGGRGMLYLIVQDGTTALKAGDEVVLSIKAQPKDGDNKKEATKTLKIKVAN